VWTHRNSSSHFTPIKATRFYLCCARREKKVPICVRRNLVWLRRFQKWRSASEKKTCKRNDDIKSKNVSFPRFVWPTRLDLHGATNRKEKDDDQNNNNNRLVFHRRGSGALQLAVDDKYLHAGPPEGQSQRRHHPDGALVLSRAFCVCTRPGSLLCFIYFYVLEIGLGTGNRCQCGRVLQNQPQRPKKVTNRCI